MDVKGTAVLTLPMFVKEKGGDEGYKKWLASLSPKSASIHGNTILASQWYPLQEGLIEPTKKICDLFFNGSSSGARELGRFSATHALSGIYKLFVKFGSVSFIVSRASSIMPTYYQNSVMIVNENVPNRIVVAMTQFESPDVLVEERICGWMEQALIISGAKDIKITIPQSLVRRDKQTLFEILWK